MDVVTDLPGNSWVRVPDLPVLSGTFAGTIDLTQAVVSDTGGVLLLFDDLGDPVRADRHHAAFYLADDRTTGIPVGPDELAIRFPTVRLDVTIARWRHRARARLPERPREFRKMIAS